MRLLKVAAACVNQTPLDWDGNVSRIISILREARASGVGVLCLPELCISGYGCEDHFLSAGVQQLALEALHEILPETKGILVALGVPLFVDHGLYDTACVVADGAICGFVCKQHLSREGIHYEPRWFNPWPAQRRQMVEVLGNRYPVGDLYFEFSGVRLGFEVCEDAWSANRPGVRLSRLGVDLILNPSASHFAFAKEEVRKRFVLEGSRAFGVGYVYANLLGNEAGRAIYDGSCLIASGGTLIAAGERFRFAPYVITSAVLDIDAIRLVRERGATSELETNIGTVPAPIPIPFSPPQTKPVSPSVTGAQWERGACVKEEEFLRAVALGLYDYMRKSVSNGFVISLSGGADSTATACLVAFMVELGVRELGLTGFKQTLRYIKAIADVDSVDQLHQRLLTCVYQSTENSSSVTREAARAVSEAIHATHIELEVGPVVQAYTELVARAVGHKFTWETDDISLQNIQARVRAPSVWLIANMRGALLLATSNRSEAAVGYTTMDGDTCGGLSPLAGIDKAFIRKWLIWLEQHGPHEFSPIPALRLVNDQEPTAELRPASSKQTDEADLMPYVVLDLMERFAIRDKKLPAEVLELVRAHCPQYDETDLKKWVRRFFVLWSRNQWKRERYAPCFHLDDENLDPKTWCRFPILSGAFARELRELE